MKDILAGTALSLALATMTVPALAQDGGAATVEIDRALGIEAMDCRDDSIELDCVTDYILSMKERVGPYVAERLVDIVEKLDRAEAAPADFEEIVRLGEGLKTMSAEGGPFATELDRIGRLIQIYREEAANDPAQADLVPLYDAEFAKWQAVRDSLSGVRENAADVVALLEAKRSRAIGLMRLSRIQAAIKEAELGVAGMESVLSALDTLASAASASPDDQRSGTD